MVAMCKDMPWTNIESQYPSHTRKEQRLSKLNYNWK